jgi:predicted transport protein
LGNDMEIKTNKTYIAFCRKHNFASIRVTKSFLKMHLLIKKSELHDPSNKVRDIGGPRHVSGLTEVIIKEQDEIHYVLPFIQQSYNKNLTW